MGLRTLAYPALVSATLVLTLPCLTRAAADPGAPVETAQIRDLEKLGKKLRGKIDQFYTENKRYCGNGQPLTLGNDLLSPYVHVGASFAESETVLRAAGFHISRPPIEGWKMFSGPGKFLVEGTIEPLEQQFAFRSVALVLLYPTAPNNYSDVIKISAIIYCNTL